MSNDERVTTVAFDDEHVDAILAGEKTTTIRYQFAHDLEPGDLLRFVDTMGVPFALAETVTQCELRADWVAAADFSGHRRYMTTADLLDALAGYYPGAEIGPETPLDVVAFVVVHEINLTKWAVDDDVE